MSKHNHKCTCEHDSVKFCKHCNTVYCLDCNQEWGNKINWTYTYPYSGGTGIYNTNSSNWAQTLTKSADSGSTCSHEGD